MIVLTFGEFFLRLLVADTGVCDPFIFQPDISRAFEPKEIQFPTSPTAHNGWRIIKTVGGKIFKLEPISGFAADLNSSIVIFTATLLHLPVSTTHVVSGSIMGVGTAKRVNAVRWGVAQQMVMAWVMTIPCTALMGAAAYQVVCMVFK